MNALGIVTLVSASVLVCAAPYVPQRRRAVTACAGVITGAVGPALMLLMTGQVTGFTVVVSAFVVHASLRLRRQRPDWLVQVAPAVLLVVLGALVAERLGREWTLVGTDPANAVAILLALALLGFGAGRLNVARPRPVWLMVAGACLLAAGLAGGFVEGTSRTSLRFPIFGEVVLAEAARALLVIGVAFEIADRGAEWRFLRAGAPVLSVIWLVLAATLLGAVIAYRTGDLGGAVLLLLAVVGVTAAMSNRTWPIILGATGLAVSTPLVMLASGHARARVLAWLHPGGQQIAALSALAEGRLFGTGFGAGNPFRVPVVASDYVIAAIGHEFGAFGVMSVVAVLISVCLLFVRRAAAAVSDRGRALCLAAVVLVGAQAAINLVGVTGMGPVTGVPLPYLSRGGVFLIVTALVTRSVLRVPTHPKRSADVGVSHRASRARG